MILNHGCRWAASTRRVALAVVGVAVAVGLAGCGTTSASSAETQLSNQTGPAGDAAWQKLVAGAKAEGEVVIYGSHAEDTLNQLATAFGKQYGIKVRIFRA